MAAHTLRSKVAGRTAAARPAAFNSSLEPLERRVLMAMSLALGGSGYSNLLASDSAALRQQKLICDPPEPFAGSTSTAYDPEAVTLRGARPGPGYENQDFGALVGVFVNGRQLLQPLGAFLQDPAGPETGYVQVRYQLSGEAGQIDPPRDWIVLDEGGTEGMDTHELTFELREGVSAEKEIVYRTFAAREGEFGNNEEDFLVTNDGTRTRLGPDKLAPAEASTQPRDGSIAGTVFNDADADGTRDANEPPMPDVTVYLDLNGDGQLSPNDPQQTTNELGGYVFDDLPPDKYEVREVVPDGYMQTPTGTQGGAHPAEVVPGRRERGLDFGNVRTPRLSDVFVRGSAWAGGFLKHLVAEQLGADPAGYRIPLNADPPPLLPWVNADQIVVRFGGPLNIALADGSVRGLRANYAVSSVSALAAVPNTYVFTLNRPLGGDGSRRFNGDVLVFELDLNGRATPGGELDVPLRVLQADTNHSGGVNLSDLVGVLRRLGSSIDRPLRYSVFHDLDADGTIDFADALLARARIGRSLPAVQLPAAAPTGATGSQAFRPVTREVFGQAPVLE